MGRMLDICPEPRLLKKLPIERQRGSGKVGFKQKNHF